MWIETDGDFINLDEIAKIEFSVPEIDDAWLITFINKDNIDIHVEVITNANDLHKYKEFLRVALQSKQADLFIAKE